MNEHPTDPNDTLGLATYTYLPNINTIRQSGNIYAYCINNPIRFVDATGNMAAEAAIAVTNWWNPIGWIAAAVIVVEVIVIVVVTTDVISNSTTNEAASIESNLGNLNDNDKKHILDDKHNWNKMVPDPNNPNNWKEVAAIISTVLTNGTQEKYKNASDVFIKTLQVGEEIVQVTYKMIEGVAHISNAWVK